MGGFDESTAGAYGASTGMPAWMRYFTVVAICILALIAAAGISPGTYLVTVPGLRRLGAALIGLGAFAALACLLFLVGFKYRNEGRGRSIVTGLIAAGISSLIALGLAELLLRTFRPALTYDRAVELSPGIFRRSTVLPFQLKPGLVKPVYSGEANRDVSFTINSHGFRGHEFSWEKPQGTYRILLLGDSFAINLGASDDEVHTAVLEQMLNDRLGAYRRYEVINAGYADGYSPDTYVAFMLRRGFDLNPDLVIMQYFVLNDFKDLLETEILETRNDMPYRVQSKCRYVDEIGRFRRAVSFKYKPPVLRNSHLYAIVYDQLRLEAALSRLAAALITNYNSDNFGPNSMGIRECDVYASAEDRPPPLQQAFDESLEYVKCLHGECKRRGADFVLFLVPTGIQVLECKRPSIPPDERADPNPQRQICAALKDSGVKILHPLRFFSEFLEGKPLYLGENQNGHWTIEGNRVAAQAMYDYLVDNVDLLAGEKVDSGRATVSPRARLDSYLIRRPQYMTVPSIYFNGGRDLVGELVKTTKGVMEKPISLSSLHDSVFNPAY